MLTRLFRSNQPGVLLALLVLLPALFLGHFRAAPVLVPDAMPFQSILNAWFSNAPRGFALVHILTIGILAIQITGLMNECELVDRRNHLPVLLFPVCLAVLSSPGALGPSLLGMPFVVFAMRRTWSMNSGGPALARLFDAGILLGLASMFYVPYAFLVVVVWASVSVIRPFQWREYLVPLVGIIVVFYLAWGTLLLFDVDHWRPLYTVVGSTTAGFTGSSAQGITRLIIGSAILLVALYHFADQYNRGVVRMQNVRSAFLAFTAALGVLILLVSVLSHRTPAVLAAVPLSMLFVYAFLGTRRPWLTELAVFSLIGLAVWQQYG